MTDTPGFGPHDLPVGGGMIALCPMPGRDGNFADDMAAVMAWGPDLVVSMTEAAEMALAKDMPHLLAQSGIGWRHFPVGDYGVPADDAEWQALAPEIKATLAEGGRVLVHCMGGCGRSGMVALRLMVEMDEEPAAALQRLRATRPCAVETDAQRLWAACAPKV